MRTAPDVTMANVEMAKHWDGEEGDDWTDHADRYDASGRHIASGFLDHQPIAPGDRVLDVGCGTGRSTREVAVRVPEGRVLGVDLSSRMLELARRRTADAGIENVDYLQADAQVHPFEPATFDLATSVFGTIFFADPVPAFENIGRALRPGGRLLMQSWRALADNEWLVMLRGALAAGRRLPEPPLSAPGPFGMADPDHVRRVLIAAGFTEIALVPIDAPIYLGSDADDAFAFVRTMGLVRGLTAGLDAGGVQRALGATRAALASYETGDGVLVPSGSWVITASKA